MRLKETPSRQAGFESQLLAFSFDSASLAEFKNGLDRILDLDATSIGFRSEYYCVHPFSH